MTVGVVGCYVAVVGLVGALVSPRGDLVVSLVVTGVVAVCFQPLRARVQRFVNRLMYGERADPCYRDRGARPDARKLAAARRCALDRRRDDRSHARVAVRVGSATRWDRTLRGKVGLQPSTEHREPTPSPFRSSIRGSPSVNSGSQETWRAPA